MEKTTLGKIQLIIGVILLLAGIIGIIYAISLTDNLAEALMTPRGVNQTAFENITLRYGAANILTTVYAGLASTSILTLFISLLFITQGAVNKSE